MTHPHILQKSMADITAVTRKLLENLYKGSPSKDADDVWIRSYKAHGMIMLWSELCSDMGVSHLINVAEQDELEALIQELDDADRLRLGMPIIHR